MRKFCNAICIVLILCCCVNAASSQETACKGLGEAPDCVGPGTSDLTQCCEGLVPREVIAACGADFGGCAMACLACGDGTCDAERENACNCPEDCAP